MICFRDNALINYGATLMQNTILMRCPVCQNNMHTHLSADQDNEVEITCQKCQIIFKQALLIKSKIIQKAQW